MKTISVDSIALNRNDFWVLAVLLTLAAVLLIRQISRFGTLRRRSFKPRPLPFPVPSRSNVHDQLEAVARVAYETAVLLNREEARLLPVLERIVAGFGAGHRVMAQTSMGEILRPRRGSGDQKALDEAYFAINSKRLDFAIFDRTLRLVLAIEYQGTGHHQNAAFLRDAVKREALRRAGIRMIEVGPDFVPEELAETLRRELGLG